MSGQDAKSVSRREFVAGAIGVVSAAGAVLTKLLAIKCVPDANEYEESSMKTLIKIGRVLTVVDDYHAEIFIDGVLI